MTDLCFNHQRASKRELRFIRRHAPRGMWHMVRTRTGKTRSQIDYQLRLMPDNQDPDIIQATREIFFVVTGKRYAPRRPNDGPT